MTRIIAGSSGGRRLETPKGSRTRPTSDRVREAFFSAVQSRLGTWTGLRVLDLYAGSGAVGIEARSRGAAEATCVEQHRAAAAVIRRNAATVGLPVDVAERAVSAFLATPARAAFDVVFSDPPYDLDDDAVESDLAALAGGGWLADGALVVVERSARERPLTWPEGFDPPTTKRYGETALVLATWAPQTREPADEGW